MRSRRVEETRTDPATEAARDACTLKLTCPRCGLTAEGVRCPRCNALKLTGCSGVCSGCGSGCATKGGD